MDHLGDTIIFGNTHIYICMFQSKFNSFKRTEESL